MYKAILLIIMAGLYNTLFAQENLPLKLTGRWQTHFDGGRADELLFIDDSKGAIITPDNRLCAYFNYQAKLNGKTIYLAFSFDVEREKHLRSQIMTITFLSDSTFLCHATGFVSSFSSYLTKKDRIYTQVKAYTPETEIQPVSYKDLKGKWIGSHLNNDDYDTIKEKDMKLFFVDEDHVVKMSHDSVFTATYKIDFTKQPSPINFTYASSGRTVQAFLMFIGTNKIRLQYFPGNNRGDHFTEIGSTIWLLRQSAANQ